MSTTPSHPPQLAQRLLARVLKEELAEEVLGDLEEKFDSIQQERGSKAARREYWYQTLHYLRPFALKAPIQLNLPSLMLFRHTLTIALRTFNRYRSTFLINLLGLSTGLACAFLIFLWVNDETGFDDFHQHGDLLYQTMLNHEESGTLRTTEDVPMLLADALLEERPEVVKAVTDTDAVLFGDNFTVSNGELFLKRHGKFTGPAYFEMFSFDLIYGKADEVLTKPGQIVISKRLAVELFGSATAAMGKEMEWHILGFIQQALVSGVFEDIPENSTEQFDFALPIEIFKNIIGQDNIHWGNYNAYTYVQLAPGTDVARFNREQSDFIKRKRENSNVNLFLRKYDSQYLYGKYENGQQAGGRIDYVRMFILIAFFILLIACINFTNLATAQASRRFKEVGVKKAMGAKRSSLVFQYLMESTLLSFFSLLVAGLWITLALPLFNDVTGKSLSLSFSGLQILGALAIVLITGLLAGSYPALYLSRFSPVQVLKGKLSSSWGETWIRRGLVLFQFSLSVILIVSVGVVYQQIRYTQTKNLGYDREHIVVFPREGKAMTELDSFLEGMEQLTGVQSATATAHTMVENGGGGYTTGVSWPGKTPEVEVRFENATVYYDLIETMGIELVAGRSFSKDFQNEEKKLILNETAIEVMGLENPVGSMINLWGEDREIVGVAKDFHMTSLHEAIFPLFFQIGDRFLPYILVKLEAGPTSEILKRLEGYYAEFNPGFPFDYRFLEQEYQAMYVAEQRISSLSRAFAILAILISCLGLFGLATFTAERRIKEIGVRKVLGASQWSLVRMLTQEFTWIVLLAIGLALPVAYLITSNWLETFAYRTDLPWAWFALAGVMALLIAWLTVGIKTYQVSRVNPARCLKDE